MATQVWTEKVIKTHEKDRNSWWCNHWFKNRWWFQHGCKRLRKTPEEHCFSNKTARHKIAVAMMVLSQLSYFQQTIPQINWKTAASLYFSCFSVLYPFLSVVPVMLLCPWSPLIRKKINTEMGQITLLGSPLIQWKLMQKGVLYRFSAWCPLNQVKK